MMAICKCECQVTALVAARIPRNETPIMVEFVLSVFLKMIKEIQAVNRDPMTVIIMPMLSDVKDEM